VRSTRKPLQKQQELSPGPRNRAAQERVRHRLRPDRVVAGMPVPEDYRERVVRVCSGRRLAPYCHTAAGLGRIGALLDRSAFIAPATTLRVAPFPMPTNTSATVIGPLPDMMDRTEAA
jgi:hypothetical protein